MKTILNVIIASIGVILGYPLTILIIAIESAKHNATRIGRTVAKAKEKITKTTPN